MSSDTGSDRCVICMPVSRHIWCFGWKLVFHSQWHGPKSFLMKSDWSSRVWSERSCYQQCLSRGFCNSLRSPTLSLTEAMPFARTVGIGSLKNQGKVDGKSPLWCRTDFLCAFFFFFQSGQVSTEAFFLFFRRDGVGGHNSDHMFNVTLIILN